MTCRLRALASCALVFASFAVAAHAQETATLHDAVKKMRGVPGTTVTISVMRQDFAEPKDFAIERDIIKLKSVKHRILDEKVGYIRLTAFQERTDADLRGALKELMAEKTPLKGIILDLRNNGLTGTLPPELGDLGDLRQLHLDGNQISGPIPTELGRLSSLDYLSLLDNQLTGSIPPELGTLPDLRYLYLRDNQLTGSIPSDRSST